MNNLIIVLDKDHQKDLLNTQDYQTHLVEMLRDKWMKLIHNNEEVKFKETNSTKVKAAIEVMEIDMKNNNENS